MNLRNSVLLGLAVLPLLAAAIPSSAQTLTITDGLQLWLRADAGVTATAAGGVVQWDDQSGNGNHAGQIDEAMAPRLVPAALNGLPVLRFDGTDDFLDVADSDSISITGDISSFFVVKFDDFATFRAVWGKTAGNLPAPTDIYALPGSGVLRVFRGDGTGSNLAAVETARALRVNTYLVLGFSAEGETLTHYLNAQPNGSGTTTINTADADTALKLGTRDDFVTRLKGDLAELLIYSRALSQTERSNVFNYLQTKYNLLNLLPTVALSTVPPGPNVNVGDLVTLNASPSDLDGTIARVEFFAHGAPIATATAAPYSVRVRVDSAGTTQFTARAVDDKDGSGSSSPVSLTATPAGPSSLPVTGGLQLWLSADAGTTVGGSGGMVQWSDQSGKANHAVQIDEAMAPTLVPAALNGLPVLRFDGMDDFLEVADSDSLSITGDITSFFVLKFDDFATFRAVWAKTVGNLPAPIDMYALPNNGRLRLFRGNGTGSGIQLVDSARPYPAGSFALGGFDMAGTTVTHYLDGLVNGIGAITVPLADGDGTLSLGTRADLVTRFKGDLAELLIYDRALTAAERRALERYLAEKYGLPALVSLANAAPVVTITGPAGPVLQAPGQVVVTADATDPDGSVASVQFFLEGNALGTDTSAPYSADLNLRYGGRVTLSTVATDNLGARSSAASVALGVQGPGEPALIGYWPLDGNANAAIGDQGVLGNDPVPAADRNGVDGGALFFDGSQLQRVEVPGGGGLNDARQGTISLWVKWTGSQDQGFGGTFGAVLSRQANGRWSDNIINLTSSDPDSAVVQWRQASAAPATITGSNSVLNDTWRHIAVTFTPTASELFVDGTSEGTGPGGVLHNDASIPLAIGAWIGDGGSYGTASIDDVAVWNRVLEVSQIQALARKVRTPLDLRLIRPDYPTIERAGSNVLIRWGSEGVLQSATSVNGPYLDVANAASPYSAPVAEASRFYRLRSP